MIGIHVRRQGELMATVLQHPFGTTAFGDFLRSARERRGLTVQQIANETKIPRRLLESLEHGDLGAIPSGCTSAPRFAPTRKPSASTRRWR